MPNLSLSLIQTDPVWEDKQANFKKIEVLIDKLKHETDVIVLPEMFSTGFTMNAEHLAEPFDNETLEWLKTLSKAKGAVITGSFIVNDEGHYRNRLVWVTPEGEVSHYDKKHLFSMAGEEKVFTAGNEKLIVEYNGWKIRLAVCYDLRFPEWLRNTDGYDLMIIVASWPDKRIHHWEKLLYARAIENQSFVAAVNRTGNDGNGMLHTGHSMIIDPQGEMLTQASEEEQVLSFSLDFERLKVTRRYMPFLKDMK